MATRFLRLWAKERGIYASRFGYLGGIHITLMVSRICKLLLYSAGAVTAADIISTFFSHYANFDWKTQMVFDPFFYKQQLQYRRSAREPMVILALHAPRVNVAHTASLPSLRTIVEELRNADSLLSNPDITWSWLAGGLPKEPGMGTLPNGSQAFLTSYKSYIKIDVQYWGMSQAKGKMLVGWLESRCVRLLSSKFATLIYDMTFPNIHIGIGRKLPDIHARIWPARFTTTDDRAEEERDYWGCYLVGLAKGEDTQGQVISDSDRRLGQALLQTTVEQFVDEILSDKEYYDPASSWVNAMLVKQAEVKDLKLDGREWGEFLITEESDTEDEPDEDVAMLDGDASDGAVGGATSAKRKGRKTPASTTVSAPGKKLRPATDILNRLRWDPNIDSSDHVVGYQDRFLGVRELALDRWKTEDTDEEFIPQHRIVYFRRISDGLVVWDREARKDEVFGSGAGKTE
jgi:uncharacterized protein (UPF0248 family)